jgi:hypothetical protein
MKKYIVRLTADERAQCDALLNKGRCLASRRKRAHVLLLADADGPALKDEDIAGAALCARATVENVRKRFVLEGFEAALERKRQIRPSRLPKLDGRGEARLIALSCGAPPEGRRRWTLALLAEHLVELEVVDSIAVNTVRATLKKTRSSRTFAATG